MSLELLIPDFEFFKSNINLNFFPLKLCLLWYFIHKICDTKLIHIYIIFICSNFQLYNYLTAVCSLHTLKPHVS